MAKIAQREKARNLRRRGISIREVAKQVGVSKSSASYWCRNIALTSGQIRRLSEKQKKASVEALLRASERKRQERIRREHRLNVEGKERVGRIAERDLFMVGLGIYWGEGNKKGDLTAGFTNSDPTIIKFGIQLFREIYGVETKDLILRVGINVIHKRRALEVLQYWVDATGVPLNQFNKTSFIKAKVKKPYENFAEHFGTLRVKVRRSTNLKREIMGSLQALEEYSGE